MNRGISELQRLFQTELLPQLEKGEADRKKRVGWIGLCSLAGSVLGIGVAFFFLKSSSWHPLAIFLAGIAGGGLTGGIACYSFQFEEYRKYYKEEVIRRLLTFINPDFRYDPLSGLSRREFEASGLYRISPDRFRSEDHVWGKSDATVFSFSEVHAEQKHTTRDSQGRTQTSYTTIFKGIWFKADFNKDFTGQTYLTPRGVLFSGGFLNRLLNENPLEKVKLEDVEFNRHFNVYSTCQVESRYILSPNLMARMEQLRRRYRRGFRAGFIQSNVILALPSDKNLFEPNLFSPLTDFALVSQAFDELALFTGIVDDLGLNTRIWTKQP